MKKTIALVATLCASLLLTSCALLPPGLTSDGTVKIADERMAEIVEALNRHDAPALTAMFTARAQHHSSAEIAQGAAYLTTLFAAGGVAVKDDPENLPGELGSTAGGKSSTLLVSEYELMAAGKTYLFYVADYSSNSIDPENVGVYRMGAVEKTSSRHSGAEMAFHTWEVAQAVTSTDAPGVFVARSSPKTSLLMTELIRAINSRDTTAIRSKFAKSALAESATNIDAGLTKMLSVFAGNLITWNDQDGGSAVDERIEARGKTVVFQTYYTVTSAGTQFRLFFADVERDATEPDNVGLQALGVVPGNELPQFAPEADLYHWAAQFDAHSSAPADVLAEAS